MIPTKLNPLGIEDNYLEAQGNPISINNVSPITHIMPTKLRSKNLLDLSSLKEKTINGVTFTPDAKNGTITVNGTATAQATYVVALPNITVNNHCLSGCPTGGGYKKFTLQCVIKGLGLPTYYGLDDGKGTLLSSENGRYIENIYIVIFNGYTANNLIFKPQLEIKKELPPTASTPYISDFTGKEVTTAGKNLLITPYQHNTATDNGITYTAQKDGTIIANGTATELSKYYLWRYKTDLILRQGCKYILGCEGIKGKGSFVFSGAPTGVFVDKGDGFLIDNLATDTFAYNVRIEINKGVTVNNLILKPQIELKDELPPTPYEPYKGNTYPALPDGTVTGVKSISPNMTLYTDNSCIIDTKYKYSTRHAEYTKVSGEAINLTDVSAMRHNVKCKLSSKNELPQNYGTDTKFGVTFTVNKDKTVNVNGVIDETAPSIFDFLLVKGLRLDNGEYYLSGSPLDGGTYTYRLLLEMIDINGKAAYYNDTGKGNTFTIKNGDIVSRLWIRIGKQLGTANNLLFKPMIRKVDSSPDYTPYIDNFTGTELTVTGQGTTSTYKAQPNGDIFNVMSKSPDMNMATNNAGTIINAEYIRR